jgi:hypothetical protein
MLSVRQSSEGDRRMPFSSLTSYFNRTLFQTKAATSSEESVTEQKKPSAEQRAHKRFEVPMGSFVSLGSNGSILGQILDVSMGGLSFRYIGDGFENGSHLDIFSTEHDFHLRKVPFKPVKDFEIDNQVLYKIGGKTHPHCRAMRRGSVKFHRLSRKQKSELKKFLKTYAVREAL